jgi:biopolymer transport protein ExbB/TolQ
VLLVLSIYFILTFWIYLDRYYLLQRYIKRESKALRQLYTDANAVPSHSMLYNYIARSQNRINRPILEAAISDTVRIATRGLTWLSIFASTSPFIGLFGTVIGILETFSELGGKSASLNVVAPAISEALVATAAGIFVAVFAYAFHLLLKRKAYELSSLLHSQAEVILSRHDER